MKTSILVPALLLLGACGIRTARSRELVSEGQLITAESIAQSGARNAWEVLKFNGAHISVSETARGEPKGMRKRGNSSLTLSNQPWVIVDEVPVIDFRNLQEIPANRIHSVRILNGTAGTAKYGTGAGNGVIVILTKS